MLIVGKMSSTSATPTVSFCHIFLEALVAISCCNLAVRSMPAPYLIISAILDDSQSNSQSYIHPTNHHIPLNHVTEEVGEESAERQTDVDPDVESIDQDIPVDLSSFHTLRQSYLAGPRRNRLTRRQSKKRARRNAYIHPGQVIRLPANQEEFEQELRLACRIVRGSYDNPPEQHIKDRFFRVCRKAKICTYAFLGILCNPKAR